MQGADGRLRQQLQTARGPEEEKRRRQEQVRMQRQSALTADFDRQISGMLEALSDSVSRAGRAVADLREVAAQTVRATAEIAGQVQAAPRDSRTEIQDVVETIRQVNALISGIAAAAEQQSAATAEIARSVESAADGNHTVSDGIADVAALMPDGPPAARRTCRR